MRFKHPKTNRVSSLWCHNLKINVLLEELEAAVKIIPKL